VPLRRHEARSIAQSFDEARFAGARIYDRRFPVVDLERGLVLSLVRFGRIEGGAAPTSPASGGAPPSGPRMNLGTDPFVADIFAVTDGKIRASEAVLAPGGAGVPFD
jgi:hypothetical protein